MEILLYIILGLSIGGILHSYIFYPLLLALLARGKQGNRLVFERGDDWPQVSILMSAYNEERVIGEKLESLSRLAYPEGKLQIFIGSDCSSDRTNELAAAYAARHPHFHFFPFEQRRGKPGVINELAQRAAERWPAAPSHVYVITDASAMLPPDSLRLMVRHFKNPQIGLVDSHLVHTGFQPVGISRAEGSYISIEARLKHLESIVWGAMIGPFGAGYAVRADCFAPVPPTFLVDDFYIAMKVFEQGRQCINDLEAICYEGVSHEIAEEYRRKARISAGNFQNLAVFRHLWWPPLRPLNFAFFSHKVLRWLSPFFLFAALATAGVLAGQGNLFGQLLFCVLAGALLLVPLADGLLKSLNVNLLPLRGAHYFIKMNLALLAGFFKYIKGIRSNVWEPTKRNESAGNQARHD